MMHDKLIIIGASGHGKVVADIAVKMNKWQEIFFLDDNKSIENVMGYKVIGNTKDMHKFGETTDFFVAIGNNTMRKKIQEMLMTLKFSVTTLIHPNAVVGINVHIGIGTVIMAGVVINSSSTIGNGCIINTSSSIDHDNHVDNYVHFSPGARTAGNVTIGEGTWIGIGSVISNNISICAESLVGASTLVIKDIKNPGTYIGIPAIRIKNSKL